MSAIRQNYSEACEAAINKQINMELYASYVYQSMAFHFDRVDVALPGMSGFFKKSSDEERTHAQMFMEYQNKRGGRIVMQDIKAPSVEWSVSFLHAFLKRCSLFFSPASSFFFSLSTNSSYLISSTSSLVEFVGEEVLTINCSWTPDVFAPLIMLEKRSTP